MSSTLNALSHRGRSPVSGHQFSRVQSLFGYQNTRINLSHARRMRSLPCRAAAETSQDAAKRGKFVACLLHSCVFRI